MKIYCASSWRNPWCPKVVVLLRGEGHDVYDFREPVPGEHGFHWSEIDPQWENWTPQHYRVALQSPIAENGFGRDMKALRECDACVLVQPCGRSAHLEIGWAAGAGKATAVFFPTDIEPDPTFGPSKLGQIEPELMAKCADEILIGASELLEWAGRMGKTHAP
jgi:hypothetical protein